MGGCCSKPVASINFTEESYQPIKQTSDFLCEEGRLDYRNREYSTALKDFEEAWNFNHKSDISLLYIGILSDTPEKKIHAFTEALHINPHNLYAKYLLAEIENTKFNTSSNHPLNNISSDFRDIIDKIVGATPRTAEDHLARAKAYEMSQDRMQQASELEKSLSCRGNINVCEELGKLYSSLGQYDEAKRIYRYGLTLEPDYVDFSINLTYIYKKLGEFEEEIKSALEGVKITKNATTYLILADAYKHTADNTDDKSFYDKAIKHYAFSMAYDKTNPLLFYRLGYAIYKQNPRENEEEAIICINEAEAITYFQQAFDSYKDITTSNIPEEKNPLKDEDPLYISKIFSSDRAQLLDLLSNLITLEAKGRKIDNMGLDTKNMKEYHANFYEFTRGTGEDKDIIFEALNIDARWASRDYAGEELDIDQAIEMLRNYNNEIDALINFITPFINQDLLNTASVVPIGVDGLESASWV